MSQEIERKFLVNEIPQATRRDHLVQGYLCRGSGVTVRIRIREEESVCSSGKGYITIKGPSGDGGLSRFEWEKEIPVRDARELLALCGKGTIDKTRCLVPEILPDGSDGPHTFEVDIFHGDNEGLVIAEVELGSAGESFFRPAWLGREVTGDRRFYNSYLSDCPFKDWVLPEKTTEI